MIETHTRILGIAPYDGMRTAMEQAAQAYPNVEMDIYTGDLEDGQAIVQQMPPNSYDCIISRGGTAALIRQVTDLPVVDIHISVYDVLRTLNKGECEYLFANSFYSLSGAMGTQAAEIRSLALLRQPVFIYGEPGTGKEQIARYLYLHSSLANHPFIVVNCALLNEKTWDFLLNHYNSPLSATGNTIYFQNFESIPPQWSSELLAAIEETGLARRVRLIFSCSIVEGEPVPEVLRHFSERLGSLALPLPSLRSRSDEIPSLSSLYLNSLNLELGKQLSGFEPRAIEMLRQYPWPNNYTQFKNVLRALAALSDGPYIRAGTVADLLSKERTLRAMPQPASARKPSEQTLEEVIRDVVQQTVAAHGGNRAAAARQLGISRTTLWRYMEKIEQKQQTVEKES